jgi:ribosome maturation factor RimP
MSQPLKLLRQYRKHAGRKVTVLLRDGRRIEGKLLEADESGFGIEETTVKKNPGGKKEQLVQQHRIALDQVKETTIVISFN